MLHGFEIKILSKWPVCGFSIATVMVSEPEEEVCQTKNDHRRYREVFSKQIELSTGFECNDTDRF